MPTILRTGPYRFYFYASDGDEPAHIHVERDDSVAKIWLKPVRLQNSGGFRRPEIGRILELVKLHQSEILEAWNVYFRS